MQEEGLHLIDASWSHKHKVENAEQMQLQSKSPVANFPERETREKWGEDM